MKESAGGEGFFRMAVTLYLKYVSARFLCLRSLCVLLEAMLCIE
jgi:hypothetical protein